MLVVFVDQNGNDSVGVHRPPDLRSTVLKVLLDLVSGQVLTSASERGFPAKDT